MDREFEIEVWQRMREKYARNTFSTYFQHYGDFAAYCRSSEQTKNVQYFEFWLDHMYVDSGYLNYKKSTINQMRNAVIQIFKVASELNDEYLSVYNDFKSVKRR